MLAAKSSHRVTLPAAVPIHLPRTHELPDRNRNTPTISVRLENPCNRRLSSHARLLCRRSCLACDATLTAFHLCPGLSPLSGPVIRIKLNEGGPVGAQCGLAFILDLHGDVIGDHQPVCPAKPCIGHDEATTHA